MNIVFNQMAATESLEIRTNLFMSLIEITGGRLKAFCFLTVGNLQTKMSRVRFGTHTFIKLKTQIPILI